MMPSILGVGSISRKLFSKPIKPANLDEITNSAIAPVDSQQSEKLERSWLKPQPSLQPQSKFLCLPMEVRFVIYELLFGKPPDDFFPESNVDPESGFPTPKVWASEKLHLLLTCRTVYVECAKMAYRNTVFHFDLSGKRFIEGEPEIKGRFLRKYRVRKTVLRNSSPGVRVAVAACFESLSLLIVRNLEARPPYVYSWGPMVDMLKHFPNLAQLAVQKDHDEPYFSAGNLNELLRIIVALPKLRRIFVEADRKENMNHGHELMYYHCFLMGSAVARTDWSNLVFDHWLAFHTFPPDRSPSLGYAVSCLGLEVPDREDLRESFGNVKHVQILLYDEGLDHKVFPPWKNECPKVWQRFYPCEDETSHGYVQARINLLKEQRCSLSPNPPK